MNDCTRLHDGILTEVRAVSEPLAPESPRLQRFSQAIVLAPLRPQDMVTTTEALPAEGICAGQTGMVLEVLAADAVLVAFKSYSRGGHAVVPIPISCLRSVRHAQPSCLPTREPV